MNRQGPTVALSAEGTEVWRGSLRQFLDDNDMGHESVPGIAAQLRRYGNAIVGGGAAGEFRLRLAHLRRQPR